MSSISMVSIETFQQLALSFSETTAEPHFDKTAFKVKRKIFATLDIVHKRAIVKLTPEDQSVFCVFDKTIIYPVANAWGKRGWTVIELLKVQKPMLLDTLTTAYCTVAPKLLAQLYRQEL